MNLEMLRAQILLPPDTCMQVPMDMISLSKLQLSDSFIYDVFCEKRDEATW